MKKLLLGLVLALAAVSCGSKEGAKPAEGGAAGGKDIKLELVSKGYQHEFWRTVEAGAKKAAEELGVKVNFIGPEKETEIGKQVGMVETAITKKVSGIILASRLISAQPTEGMGYEMDAIAAVVIGGASLAGGTGTIFGTMLGAFIMTVLKNGLTMLNVSGMWQQVAVGAVVLGAVYIDNLKNKR